jgi:RNA-splicing ligase RtcB
MRWSRIRFLAQATELLRGLRKTAVRQLGTSGTGNHFVEWGSVKITVDDNPLGVAAGDYLALLSHSGSRGVGYKIADYYSNLAMSLMRGLPEHVKHLARDAPCRGICLCQSPYHPPAGSEAGRLNPCRVD